VPESAKHLHDAGGNYSVRTCSLTGASMPQVVGR
jgi:hypothetical protein